jgi:hypothetical protein
VSLETKEGSESDVPGRRRRRASSVAGIVAGYVGFVAVLIVRNSTVEDQVTYREACGLSSRENRNCGRICEA